ncbi:uncharacterized protein ACNLHF_007164 isoform 1-T3 [Anomaloglossus baeobatrachus]|uniref:uncharacterized protein LOC142255223 n=1 Tax=Anomaloglossus baeobatrachus TaxID=238106 RepID=UPI003F50D312
MPSCIVHGCRTKKNRDPSRILHSFPKEPEKMKLWLLQTGQYGDEIDQMVIKVYLGKVHDSHRMCSLHFTHDCYHYDGYRRILKKDAIPTVFNVLAPRRVLSISELPSFSGQQVTKKEFDANSQKLEAINIVRTYQGDLPVIHPKTPSLPTIQNMTLVPVVPQHVFFQPCGISQNLNPVVSDKSLPLTMQSSATTTATQMPPELFSVNQQTSVSTPSTSSIMEVSASSSYVQLTTSAISQFKASSHGEQLEQITAVNFQQSTLAPVTFLQNISPSVLTKTSLPSDTKVSREITSLSSDTSSSTTSSSPIISSSPSPSPVISDSRFDKSSSKTLTSPPINVPLMTVSETKPCSLTIPPVSGKLSTVTQRPPTSSLTQKPPSIPIAHTPPTAQTVSPGCVQPSKKRKLDENVVLLEPIAVSSSGPSVLSNMSQAAVNTGKLIFVPHSAPFVQPSCLIQKPLMVDKGVNTDSFTNRRSCCVATDPFHRRRTIHTQTKIYKKHRKIMCTLLRESKKKKEIQDSESDSTVSLASPDDIGFSDCGSSSSSDNDACEDLETVNLDLVKVEILSDLEVDPSVPTSSGKKHTIHIKEEDDSSTRQEVLSLKSHKINFTIPDYDNPTLKIEPGIKTEEDHFPISIPTQNISNFISQNPKIERLSPIPSEPLAPVSTNATLWGTSALQTDDEQVDPSDYSFHINELSEDEDELFLAPSDDEDDVKRVFQDLDSPVENPVEEEKYLVFESCLKKLIMMIPCMSESKCTSPLTHYRKETIGSYLSVEVRCRSGHTRLLWESQPRHGYQPLGNVLLSAAVLLSGSSFLKSQHMFKLLNVKSIDKTNYYKNQSMFLFPAINHHWKEEQKTVIRSIRERALCLAGDQQLDNPGFSPKYSVYSLMDVASKKICSFSVEPVTPEVTSETPEKIGFQKTMGDLQTMNADVKMIVTDRSVAVQEILKDNYPSIVHQIDLWHLSKSIGNEVLLAAKQKDCEVLYEWVEAIRNHIWWSSCTCCKNPDMLIKKWKSVLHHVTNVHEWGGDSDCKACHHPPLPEEVVSNTNWLEKDSPAYKQLKNIVENKSLLKDLKQLSFLCHLGELEIYHSACLKYRPKTLHFFMDSMVARTQLAALDHNRNVHRVKEVVKNASHEDALGSGTQRLEVSKGQKSWIVKAMYEPTCQNILLDIMNDVIALVREQKTFQ